MAEVTRSSSALALEKVVMGGVDDMDRLDSGVWLGIGTNATADGTSVSADTQLSSQRGAAINLINCAIGAGIVGLPYALAHAGIIVGLPLLFVVCYLTHHAIMVLVETAHQHKLLSYQDLVERLLGRFGFIIFSLAQFVLPFGTLCAYGIIVGDYLVHLGTITGVPLLANRSFVIVASTVFFMLPLSLYTNMAKLEPFSAVSVVSVLVIIVAVAVQAPNYNASVDLASTWMFGVHNRDLFMAVGVMTHAFVCHHNMFLVYESFRDRSPKRFEPVSRWSCLSVLLLNLGLAMVGFLNFAGDSNSNILNNFSHGNDVLIDIARIAFSLNVIVTFPTQVLVARQAIERFFFYRREFNTTRHVLITLFIVFSATAIALVTAELGEILELNGSFAATSVAFIFPALCGFAAQKALDWRSLLLNGGMLLLGTSVMGVKAVMSIHALFQ